VPIIFELKKKNRERNVVYARFKEDERAILASLHYEACS